MAEGSHIVKTKLFCVRAEDKTLADAAEEYFKAYGQSFALLYTPSSAYVGRLKSQNHFLVSSGKEKDGPATLKLEKDQPTSVFEARIFNETAELRWLNKENGRGPAVVLCEDNPKEFFGEQPAPFKTKVNNEDKDLVDKLDQTYLVWGESVGASTPDGWTRFASARIGSFFVPIKDITEEKKARAMITGREYLGEFEDGNVAVVDERLIGIGQV